MVEEKSVNCSLLLITIATALLIHGCSSCLDTERVALLELKAFFKSVIHSEFADNVLASWPDDRKSDCCNWGGVKCSVTTRRVVELQLNGSTYPSEEYVPDRFPLLNLSLLHPFEELQGLGLTNNFFGGWFDNIEGSKSFAKLKKLEILNLESNSFNSSIFPFLSAATSLRTLNLSGNSIGGVCPPEELSNLRNLRMLDLSHNEFSLLSAEGFANLTKLEALDLSDNEFSGYLQLQGICELKNLRELDLSNNEFSGHLPRCLSNLMRLQVLDVTSNQLRGNPELAITHLTSLEYLSLYENSFEGSFSFSSLANHSKLEVFRLSSIPGLIQVKTEGSWLPTFQLKALQLRNCSLNGTFPSFLLHQSNLRFIDLSHNKLVGTIPSWLLENNSKLEAVYVMNNSFADLQLPQVMHGLLHFEVSDNDISGLLPDNINRILPKLECLNFSRNTFQGGIPSAMGEMKSLEILDLSHNNLSGKLPRKLVTGCYSLKFLKLSNNSFEGQIFPEYVNLTQLMWLHTDSNKFTGSIGKGLLNSVSLKVLDVSSNMLSGGIPDWIGSFPGLMILLMGRNRLEGRIPDQLGKLPYLKILDISRNSLSASIPSSFNLSYLSHLYLHNNDLVGSMPDELFQCKGLVTLDLRNNKLSGSIPKSISKLSWLSVLLLRGNHILGHIPNEICQLKEVNFLDLSHNRLNGSIPSCINNMSFGMAGDNASKLHIQNVMGFADDKLDSYYQYTSTLVLPLVYADYEVFNSRIKVEFATKSRYESFEGGILPYMFGLDLSTNELTGDFPRQIGDLQNLLALNLSHNQFSGSIPESFSNLKKIESLDLSYNRLQGHIPPQLAELHTLEVFYVSYNNLSGSIPYKGQFATFGESSYAGNNGLCGQPTNTSCYDTTTATTTTTKRSKGEDEDFVWFYRSFAGSYVTVLLSLFAFLSIDSRWSRAWFRLVDLCISSLERLKRLSLYE